MSKNNVRIAIRDSTDSHNVAFFDNKAGIKYKSANLYRFLAGSASILTIKYNSKDIDSIRSGCKLAFRYKNRDYWLNVMSFEKKGFEVELTAYSLGIELNNETRGEHKPANAMSIAEYVAYYDPEHALTIGVNEVSDKRIKLEWTGTDTILARLFSIANSFGAELDFNVELNDDYSLKRQVLNIYKKGNLGTNKVSQPVRVGKELKVINYSDNIKELRTAVRATGKDGLTIDGLNKKIYDNNKELLYYSSGMTVYAPQSRDRFPSVGKGSNDNWIVEDLGETQYETKEALWGYLYSEIQKKSLPEITYEVEGAIDAGIGDTQTLIDDKHFEPALYVQARVSELEDDILTGKVTKSTFINFERKYSQIADELQKRVNELVEASIPYTIKVSSDNGTIFKNATGTSTFKARVFKGEKEITSDVTWHWTLNSIVTDGMQYRIQARDITDTAVLTVDAFVGGNKVATTEITLTNINDGAQGPQGPQGADGPQGPQGDEGPKGDKGDTGNGIANTVVTYGLSVSDTTEPATWSSSVPTLVKGMYLWTRTVIIYTNGESTTSYQISYIAKDADATAAIDKTKQELTEKLETVRNDSLAAVEEAKQELTTVSNDLSKAKTDLQNAVSEVDTKATNLQSDLSKAKQDLTSQAQQLQAQGTTLANQAKELQTQASQLTEQAKAQETLTTRVENVETTANGTKTTVSELSKTVTQNGKDITSISNRTKTVETNLTSAKTSISELQTSVSTAKTDLTNLTKRTKTVEDGLTGTKTTLSQVQTTANSTSQKTATLETGLNGLTAKFDSLKIGSRNYFKDSKSRKYYINDKGTQGVRTFIDDEFWKNDTRFTKDYVRMSFDIAFNPALPSNFTTNVHFSESPWYNCGGITFKGGTTALQHFDLKFDLSGAGNSYKTDNVFIRLNNTLPLNTAVSLENFNLYLSAVVEDYSQNEADIEQKVADYKQTADQNYASLQTTVQNLDGTVQQNKTVADQTAQGFSTRIESLETYKDGETTRANQYFESAKTETARQLTAERTAIAKDYVAKSMYTSDVTGIRNDLTATTTTANTTKTNLANYQASNDKAVANLQSNLQTANGNISSLQTKVEAVPGQITSAVSAVEGKIPTSAGGRNLALGTSADWSSGWTNFNGQNNQTNILYRIYNRGFKIGDKINVRIVLKYSNIVAAEGQTASGIAQCAGNVTNWGRGLLDSGSRFNFDGSSGEIELKGTTVVDEYMLENEYWNWHLRVDYVTSGKIQWKEAKAEVGDLPTPWSPAPEDTATQISNLSSRIQQTADGMTLLATKTELNSAKTELQSGITTATSKADNAQATANSNAQTISTHTTQISALNTGLSAKVSQTDFNTLSGRVTTAENNITAKANELSSKITSVEGKIPTSSGGRNLAQGTSKDWSNPFTGFSGIQNTCPNLYKVITNGLVVGDTFKTRIVLKYTNIRPASGKTAEIWLQGAGNVTAWNSGAYPSGGGGRRSLSGSGEIVFELTDKIIADHLKNDYWNLSFRTDWIASGSLQWRLAKAERGMFFTDWSPAPEDTISQINAVSSEIKQTTDSIKASVSSLDKSTVKSSSLTINADGIVMKAGKSTTDVANAIGSYFAVNQNAINLFSDKIKVKGNMIVSGSISSDKISSSGITANVIKGGTLQSTNGSTNFELNTGKLFYNNNNTGVFRVQNGASTMGLKFSNTSVTVNGTSRILSRTILGGDRRETTLDDGKWDKGGFSGLVIETIKGVEPATNEHADAMRVISDNIYFTHTYSADSPTGISAHGWKMETYAPDSSYSGNIVLKPYGINYRQSDIIVGDVRLDNGDGSGYWMRATINTLKNCFGHILNGGVSSSALNAIRSELNKISGT